MQVKTQIIERQEEGKNRKKLSVIIKFFGGLQERGTLRLAHPLGLVAKTACLAQHRDVRHQVT